MVVLEKEAPRSMSLVNVLKSMIGEHSGEKGKKVKPQESEPMEVVLIQTRMTVFANFSSSPPIVPTCWKCGSRQSEE